MNVHELRDIAADQLLDALIRTSSKKEISGVAFTATFKKAPAFETKAIFSFEKNAAIETEEE